MVVRETNSVLIPCGCFSVLCRYFWESGCSLDVSMVSLGSCKYFESRQVERLRQCEENRCGESDTGSEYVG